MGKQQGFNPFGQTMVLAFEDSRWAGAEVRVRRDLPVVEQMELAAIMRDPRMGVGEQGEFFAERILIDWNLLDADGVALPASKEGMAKAPAAFVQRLVNVWVDNTWSHAPLGADSSAG